MVLIQRTILHAGQSVGIAHGNHVGRARVGGTRQMGLSQRHSLISRGGSMDVRCRAGEGLPPELKQSIDDFVQENTVVVFMKGTKDMPMCGFSNTVVQILNQLNVPYVTVNILDNDVLRSGMKEYSMWPTFPQVYVSGEFYGGCDIMIESYTSGELQEALEIALLS